MGSSPSKLRRNESTPTMAYGRLRIMESPNLSSPSRRHQLPTTTLSNMQRAQSLDGLSPYVVPPLDSLKPTVVVKTEATPLLASSSSSIDETKVHKKKPRFAVWISPALLCAVAYAMYNIFIKLGSYSIHPVLGGVILQLVAAILGLGLLTGTTIQYGREELEWDLAGIQWSICAGIAVGLAEMLSFFVSSRGVQAVQSIPVIIGGSVMFGTILGLLLLKENLTPRGWFGVLLIVGGLCLVGTDPGALNSG